MAKYQINIISTKYAYLSLFPILVNGTIFYAVVQKNLGVNLNFSFLISPVPLTPNIQSVESVESVASIS